MFNEALETTPYMDLNSKHTNLILTSTFNHKFSNRFTNKTGFTYNAMFYKMNLAIAPYEAHLLETVSQGDGHTSLFPPTTVLLSDWATTGLSTPASTDNF